MKKTNAAKLEEWTIGVPLFERFRPSAGKHHGTTAPLALLCTRRDTPLRPPTSKFTHTIHDIITIIDECRLKLIVGQCR